MSSSNDPVYRCRCSWVGGDPDIGPGRGTAHPTCPACWHHDRKRVVVNEQRIVDGRKERRALVKRLPDLFKPGITVSMIRLLIERGTMSARGWKAERVARGGTIHSTNSFKRYFVGVRAGGTYVPMSGSHEVIDHTDDNYRWVGSEGDTFEARAAGWLARMTPVDLDATLVVLERAMLTDGGAERELTMPDTASLIRRAAEWFALATAESQRRSREMTLPSAATVRSEVRAAS